MINTNELIIRQVSFYSAKIWVLSVNVWQLCNSHQKFLIQIGINSNFIWKIIFPYINIPSFPYVLLLLFFDFYLTISVILETTIKIQFSLKNESQIVI